MTVPIIKYSSSLCEQTSSDTSMDKENIEENKFYLRNPSLAGKFKILTCSSTSCAAKRKTLQQDEFSTFTAFYTRIQERAPSVQLEESPCLGSCENAPCVGIEHDDFNGPVSLEQMSPSEFQDRVFHKVMFDEDADRVWHAVEDSIRFMAEQEEGNDPDNGLDISDRTV